MGAPQNYPRHSLAETKDMLRKHVWHLAKLGVFYRHPSEQLMLIWLIENVDSHQRAPEDHGRWDELSWFPRIAVSPRDNAARRIAEMTGQCYQSVAASLKSLQQRGLISYDDGYRNVRIRVRDQDDAVTADVLPQKPAVKRTAEVRGDAVQISEVTVRPGKRDAHQQPQDGLT